MSDARQSETLMADHIKRFWRLLATEHVRILVDVRVDHDEGQPPHWDGYTFSNEIAKALAARQPAPALPEVDQSALRACKRESDNRLYGVSPALPAESVGREDAKPVVCRHPAAGQTPWRTTKVYHCADCERQDGNHTWPIYDATGRKLSIHYLDEATAKLIVHAVNALPVAPLDREKIAPDRSALRLAAKEGNLQFWRDQAAQQASHAAWKAGGFVGDCPQHIKGTVLDYIVDAILAVLSPVSGEAK